ncbi:oxaloacetate decarboxylase [Pedobacter sp. L105]|uniref:isocitrate lyase/PEP mutase family protein n=1 Tax=Pedobacter sp. L105 TaxID=1641871 RepID=UPI001C20C3A2|nr:isocitrate lyase/phosphoenolpyruvate mutase family protein [Pedobacter sp. L105]
MMVKEKRVVFDFDVEFTNGGGIQGQGFRLDITAENIGDAELATYIVSDMRLLMVKKVNILNKYYITEPHKRKLELNCHIDPASTDTIYQKAGIFKSLHERSGIFVVANAWDAGSAKALTSFGFEALATTSAGLAFSMGKVDGQSLISREQTLLNAKNIADATNLPVSADLERCFGDQPDICAETILMAGNIGLAGGSIEDATGNPADPIYPFDYALERVKAAIAAARSLPYHFTLTARAENLIHGRIDLNDTIRRLVAFADAGADVLFAPGLRTPEDIEAVVKAVAPHPVNVVMGIPNTNFSLNMLEDIGVKRVSVGGAFFRAAYGAFFNAADEVFQKGTFQFGNNAISSHTLNELFNK